MGLQTPLITLVVAHATNRAIGKDNQLLWHLPNDLKFFKKITTGHTVIMGRKTFESIGRPLPNRRNIVITRNKHVQAEGVEVVASIKEAIQKCVNEVEIFFIGGGEIYRQILPIANRIYLTLVHTSMDADTFFPELDPSEWQIQELDRHPLDEKHPYSFDFLKLDRIV